MSDMVNALVVVLEKDIREDDAKKLIAAIKQFAAVRKVSMNIADINTYVIETRIKMKLYEQFTKMLVNE